MEEISSPLNSLLDTDIIDYVHNRADDADDGTTYHCLTPIRCEWLTVNLKHHDLLHLHYLASYQILNAICDKGDARMHDTRDDQVNEVFRNCIACQ